MEPSRWRPTARLILHFDVNETILVGDPAGGDTFEESLNKIVCKSSFVKTSAAAQTAVVWYDGKPLASPPPPLHTAWEWPPGCVSAYRSGAFDAEKKAWTEPGRSGAGYRSVYTAMEAALRDGITADTDPRLSHDGVHHFLIPSFLHTIKTLAERGREFTIVIRTFGTDIDDVVDALNAFAEQSSDAALTPFGALTKESVWSGKYGEDGCFVLRRGGSGEKRDAPPFTETVTDESTAVRLLEAVEGGPIACVACTDDYEWWSTHGCRPDAGKPLWITDDDTQRCHHIFFDDNIHNLEDDSIVGVRSRASAAEPFVALGGRETIALQGKHLVRVPTVEPILNQEWFLEQIEQAERARAAASK